MSAETLIELGKLGGWGVAVLVIAFLFKLFGEKREEQKVLLKIISDNAEALTKLTAIIERQGNVLDKQSEMLNQQNGFLMQLCLKNK